MRRLNRSPQDMLLAIHKQLKTIERNVSTRIIGATLDWRSMDAVPFQNGFFNNEADCLIEITIPAKIVSEKGVRAVDIEFLMSAVNLLEGQQFYIQNPYYSRESPKKYMFLQDDFRQEILRFADDYFHFDNGFYSVFPNEKNQIMHFDTQESFDLNVHALVSPNFRGVFPFIGAVDKGLEALFVIYYGYWLQMRTMMTLIQKDVSAYKQIEAKLLMSVGEKLAPYRAFTDGMDNLYRSAFYELQTNGKTPPRRYMLSMKIQEQLHYIFISAYTCTIVNVELYRCVVLYQINTMKQEDIMNRLDVLNAPPLENLLKSIYL